MWGVARLALVLWAVLVALSVIWLGVGRADAGSALPLGLARCGEPTIPCLMGQIPGTTSWKDAKAAMAPYAVNMPSTDRRIIIHLGQRGEIMMFPTADDRTVGRMQFTVPQNTTLAVGWVIERFGLPCGVSIYHDPKTLTLRYPGMLANVRLSGADPNAMNYHLDIQARVINILYYDPIFRATMLDDPCADNVTDWRVSNRGWQGFASVRHYVTYHR